MEDTRGICNRKSCIYNDGGRCDMWDDIDIPDNVMLCENFYDQNAL